MKSDIVHMAEALRLAELGRGRTHPNPLVGAVVVRDGQVVGRGYHRGPGEAHAEAVALAEAGPRARGATLYSTLEPCVHQGKTPPCTRAILAAGVKRVVIALRDPNPRVDGRGIEELREGGVAVQVLEGDAAAQAARQNEPFLSFVRTGLPRVTYKAAMSLDGKTAAANGDARWVSGDESRRIVHEMRRAADAVLVGAGTVRRDDPLLTVRMVRGRSPVRVIATHHGDVPLEARVVTDARRTPTLLLAQGMHARRRATFEDRGVGVVEYGEGGLAGGLRALAARGLLDILCEGGPGLAGALVAEGLVSRLTLFVAPLLVGRGAPDILAVPAVARLDEACRLADVEWHQVAGDLMLSARLGVE